MADDVRITMTGDADDLKREYKKMLKLMDKFDKANKKSTQRREKQAQASSKKIERITASEVRKTMAIRKRANMAVARDRKQREREAIRSERREARARERILKRFAARRQRIMRGVGRFGMRGLGLLGIGGGIGVVMKAREILQFDVALARIAGAMDITNKRQMEIRKNIMGTSLAFGVQRDVIMETFEEIVDKSGKIDLAVDNFEVLAKILRGTKAEAKDVGALFASISNAFKGTGRNLKNSEIAEYVEILAAQGDIAQINIANLASQGEKLFGAFKGAGFGTRRDLINFGALIQTAGETGTPEEAATSAVRVLSALFEKTDLLKKKFNVNVFGKKGELRPLDAIMKEIMLATGQKTAKDATKLIEIFGKRSIKTMKVLAAEFRNNNEEFSEFARSLRVGENATENFERKFQRVAETSSQGFERMAAALTMFADEALVGILNDIADSIGRMIDDPKGLQELKDTFKVIGDTIRFIYKGGKIAALPFKLAGKAAEELAHGYQNIAEIGRRLTPVGQSISGNKAALRERYGKEMIDKIELNLNTQTTVDESGNVLKEGATLQTQINSDRGSESKTVSAFGTRGRIGGF